MINHYKQKIHTFQAVEFTNALSQAPEVANLIEAESLSVDVSAKSARFTVGERTYEVKVGQVVSVDDNGIHVTDAEDFYSQYEQV